MGPPAAGISEGCRDSVTGIPASPIDEGPPREHHRGRMLRRTLFTCLLAVGAVAAIAYPAIDLVAGRGPQWTWLNNEYPPLAFFAGGACLFLGKPAHPVARRLLLAGTGAIVAAALGQLVSVVAVRAGTQGWFWIATAILQAAFLVLLVGLLATFAVYPDGRYQRAYERWTVRAAALLPVLLPALVLVTLPMAPLNPFFVWAEPTVRSPLYWPALAGLGHLATALSIGGLTLVAVAAGFLIARYRRLDTERRRQARWPLFSLLFVIPFGMGPVGYLVGLAGWFQLGPNEQIAAEVVLPTLPIALVVGQLRPQLFDLELVIRKSVVYAVLWLLISLAYVGLAVAVGVVTAQQRHEIGLVVLATIAATLAFQPARAALERLASRLVYGRRLSSYQAVSRLGAGLEAAANARQVGALLEETVREALDAGWARVLVEGAQAEASDGPGPVVLTAPLTYGVEVIGRVECGPKNEGGRYRVRDEELLETLARNAALAIRNARLAAELADRLELINVQAQELQASRARIVKAEDTGRRRLERDIHDGVQQELVALLAKIWRARNQLGRDPEAVGVLLEELQEDTKLALRDLRDLAQGIHPSVLSDSGLAEAVEDRLARLPAQVLLDADDRLRAARFDASVEGAAYFMVCEALANAMKHAGAARIAVRLALAGDDLIVEVSDNGAGFDAAGVTRSGLSGLSDRIEALGGRFEVSSSRGRGTRLLAQLPARSASIV